VTTEIDRNPRSPWWVTVLFVILIIATLIGAVFVGWL